MKKHTILFIVLFAIASGSIAGCSESDEAKRVRLTTLIRDSERKSEAEQTVILENLSSEDRTLFAKILREQIDGLQGGLDTIAEVLPRLKRMQVENPEKADRLVAECELETGVSYSGAGALPVAECVTRKW